MIEKNNIKYKKYIKNIKNVFINSYKYLKKNNIFKIIIRSIGLFILIISGLAIFTETLGISLISSNVAQFELILKSIFNFQIFDYISQQIFCLILGGGYLIDISFWMSLFLVGYYLWSKKNLFKTKILFSIILALVSGITLLSFGLFYGFPGIKVPLEKIENYITHSKNYENHTKHGNHKIIQEIRCNNGKCIYLNNFRENKELELKLEQDINNRIEKINNEINKGFYWDF